MTKNLNHIFTTLTENSFQCLIAGGAVRDLLMGKNPHDIDIVTDAKPFEIESLFPHTLSIGKVFGVTVVVLTDGEQFEIATFRKDSETSDGRRPDSVEFTNSASADAQRRDFTINAMFQNPLTGEILDFFNGQRDIADKLVHFVGNPFARIKEDKLRMLRAIRFAANLDFKLSDSTFLAIAENAELIHEVSAERINAELTKMLMGRNPKRAIQLLEQTGLLDEILPEVAATMGVEQPKEFHPEGDVFQHTIEVVHQLRGCGNIALLMAGLLHDIGKPACAKFNEVKGRVQFIGHDLESKRMAEKIMRRLKFTNDQIKESLFAIEHHMTMHNFHKMKLAKQRLLAEHDHFNTLVQLSLADTRSTGKDGKEMLDTVAHVQSLPDIPKLVTGWDLMEIGLTGERIGRALRAIKLGQLAGTIRDRESALKTAKGVL